MSRFNLLEENWIRVLEEGEMKEVSLITLFENAEKYRCLAGEMATQNFAMLRFLLAVLHTVFSRVNADGEAYEFLEIDEKFRQKEAVSEDDEEEYNDALMETWKTLWQRGKFPSVVRKYLEAWKDHFYLLDEKYPFYQVTKEEIDSRLKENKNPGSVAGKKLNRTISESDHKVALFSPKGEEYKSKMSEGEFLRWLIMLQGYFGISDKVKFDEEYKASIGWQYGLGGIFVTGQNLFETLMFNFRIIVSSVGEKVPIQNPCWENSGKENINKSFSGLEDNLAGLYTNWSRAILVNSKDIDFSEDLTIKVVKLPLLDPTMIQIEPMTLWKYVKEGENKNHFIPKKHEQGQALWKSFGIITIPSGIEGEHKEPGVIEWLERIQRYNDDKFIRINAVALQYNSDPKSRMPINEMIDDLALHEIVLFEKGKEGWVTRIKEIVEDTKEVVGFIYKGFLKDVYDIRNTKKSVEEELEQAYFGLDKAFRDWLSGIDESSSKEDKIKEWKVLLFFSMKERALEKVNECRQRDIKGIYEENAKGVKNIFTAYEYFLIRLKKKLNQE